MIEYVEREVGSVQVQGYQKKSKPELLKALDACVSIGQVCALVQHENIVIQMKSQSSASNIPSRELPKNPAISPLDSLKAQVREAICAMPENHTREQLIRAVQLCPTIDKLFELVKNEHIVIQMKAQHSASCLPRHSFGPEELIPDKSPLDMLKDQVLSAIVYGG